MPVSTRLPSLCDWLFIALFAWLLAFSMSEGHGGLLQDAATGSHIRIGDYVLAHHQVPRVDMLSFTYAGRPWFAFEWLAGVVFSILHSALGMNGVVVFCGAMIAFTICYVTRHSILRGGEALVVIFLLHLVIGASSIHFVARPHLFTLMFCAIAFRALDLDLDQPSNLIWLLVPLTVVWANLHPGFIALVVSTAILAGGKALEGSFRSAMRYAVLTVSCLLASALNPYGFRVHAHVVSFVQGSWVSKLIQEHQPPNFRSTEGVYFELLLLTGIAVAVFLVKEKDFARALWILAWAHAALLSVRHIPIYALVLFPLASQKASIWFRSLQLGRNTVLGTLRQVGRDYAPSLERSTVWPLLAVCTAVAVFSAYPHAMTFSEERFPVRATEANAQLLSDHRVYSTDAWSDYLTYRLYPHFKSFIDGRGDLFGGDFSQQYLDALNGEYGWEDLLRRYSVDAVFVPKASGLAAAVRHSPEQWTVLSQDAGVFLAERKRNRPAQESSISKSSLLRD